MSRELDTDEQFSVFRDALDDLLRQHSSEVGPHILDDEDDLGPVENPILSEWVLMTAWIDAEGDTHYVRVCSPKLPAHHRLGLIALWEDD